jgi:hypothetical protein
MKRLFALSILVFALGAGSASAGMIATDQAVQAPRERVKAMLARPEVANALGKFGISAEQAKARVDAMTDDEVAQLAARIDALPAGGVLTNDELIVILLLVIIIVLLL